ncbi:MAG: hypothetical protein Ta2A_25070 [Treponemataceae bacterium]|nr:MAG: hypothetical protein Ta2A_25070 [Treponemataceae bacterium]
MTRLSRIGRVRLLILGVTAIIHLALIFFFRFGARIVDAGSGMSSSSAPNVMKLTDVTEYVPPSPVKAPVTSDESETETVAENMLESDEAEKNGASSGSEIEYMPQYKISNPPIFSESEIRKALVYPVIAQKSGIEGLVHLELFIDRDGNVRKVTVLKEEPSDRGFGDAAVNAFKNLKAQPAEANGVKVAVRYRYPVRFTLR